MKILFDITHPAHVLFFKPVIELLNGAGHTAIVASRKKDVATDLLDKFKIPHIEISKQNNKNIFSSGKEMFCRGYKLYKLAREENPDAIISYCGVSAAQVGKLLDIPSIIFTNTEIAKLQNLLSLPIASKIIVPEGWLNKKSSKYTELNGCFETNYLHPEIFIPDEKIALEGGLKKGKDNFFIRIVSWQAAHDVGKSGWDLEALRKIISDLEKRGHVHISSEKSLPDEFSKNLYKGDISEIHHLLAYCKLYIGESATMAAEAATLGVPAIYMADFELGYIKNIEKKYGLIKHLKTQKSLELTIEELLKQPPSYWKDKAKILVKESDFAPKNILKIAEESLTSH